MVDLAIAPSARDFYARVWDDLTSVFHLPSVNGLFPVLIRNLADYLAARVKPASATSSKLSSGMFRKQQASCRISNVKIIVANDLFTIIMTYA